MRGRPWDMFGMSTREGVGGGGETLHLQSSASRHIELTTRCTMMQAADLVKEVQRDNLQGLMRKAAAAHPGYTLGILAEGLVHHCDMRERRENGAFDTRPIYRLIDSLGVCSQAPTHPYLPPFLSSYPAFFCSMGCNGQFQDKLKKPVTHILDH